MQASIRRFIRDEHGGPAIEYGLIAGLISISIIVATTDFADSLSAMFGAVSGFLAGIIVS
ncbi:MAG: Flp family type IVb pilin [Hyphomicrobium sp.]|nr:Flp family type IVb pilin [Hyphomicrobium sp.]